ncbi:tautomerase family protein [Bacillus sp. NP157]|nr:tautomerase family protein [Bacillus sp. NP157]
MPLIRIDVAEGRTPAQLRTLADAVHEAMVAAFSVPARDRYQVIQTHPPGQLILEDTGLGFERSAGRVLVHVFSRPRTRVQKETFYRGLSAMLLERCGLAPEDLVVSISSNADDDWSFGFGRAQFLTGEL